MMKTLEQKLTAKLEKSTADLKAARKQIRVARSLLTRAVDVIPNYTDGRNDRLCDAIENWIAE